MADWADGYVTDVAYTYGFYREFTPIWLSTAATLLGFRVPDLTGPIRFADLGCGNGVTALVVAATMPHAEVWGFDFNPAHIAFGRDVARRAGLTNIHFEEASFEDLVRLPQNALPMFDFIASHGVLSWISLENRRRMFAAIGQRLAPGGIAYVSYNLATGWAGMAPVRVLMRLLTEASPDRTDVAAAKVLDTLERMKAAGAAVFRDHPGVDQRVAGLRGQDQRYVAHELLNRDWHPVMFPTVAAAMADIKCDYIGSASLQDNVVGLTVPAGLHEIFNRVGDTGQRETLRDIASGQSFRRDMYQRGPRRLITSEFGRAMDGLGLTRTFRPVTETIEMTTPLGPVTASEPAYRTLLSVLEPGPMTVEALRRHKDFAGTNPATFREAVTLLLDAGWLAPLLPESPGSASIATSAQLNQAHAALFDDGHDLPVLAYPALGCGWHADPLDILVLDELRTRPSLDETALVDAIVDRLARNGRQLQQDGQAITSPEVLRARVAVLINEFLRQRLPAMRKLGMSTAMAEAA